jgi:hypothetical protein
MPCTWSTRFGSAARGEKRPDSDLDFFVDMEEGPSLVDHVAFRQDLEDLLDRDVDVVTERALHSRIRERVPRIRERVLREVSPLQ